MVGLILQPQVETWNQEKILLCNQNPMIIGNMKKQA